MPKDKKPVKKVKGPEKASAEPSEEIKIIRIAESDLKGNQKLEHALTKIKGIGWSYARALRKATGLENKKLGDLSEAELNKVKDAISNPVNYGIPAWLFNKQKDPVRGTNYHLLSSDLRLSNRMDIESLKKIKCYRGVRHFFNYKVRGQRTRSRGANVKGRVGSTVGVVKKKQAPQKSEK